MRAAVMIMAGGSGSRAAATIEGVAANKVYLPLAGRPVLAWSLLRADQVSSVDRLVLVIRADDEQLARRMLAEHPPERRVSLVVGGDTRHASEQAGLAALESAVRTGEIDVIAVHDGARPLAPTSLFDEVILAAAEHGGAVPATTAGPLITRTGGPTPDREVAGSRIVRVQTPQAFRAGPLLDAYAEAARQGFVGTDTAASVEAFTDLAVHVVPGPGTNIKITYPGDLDRAEQELAGDRRSA